ncbi:MAG: tRNA (adenosine(37)-N6)-threonylcarbamoyltransferase complex ATPase subunit type 1 TsaE [Lactovum sp.]
MKVYNEEGLTVFAEKLGRLLKAGDLIILTGDLAAGKTTFTKGLALGLDISQMIKSPTFTIVREYQGRLPLYHMDIYRVGNDPDSFDMDGYLSKKAVVVMEWGELLEENLPKDYLSIQLNKISEDRRELILSPSGQRYEQLIKEIENKK